MRHIRNSTKSYSISVLSDKKMPTNEDYYLCIKATCASETALSALRDWFHAQVSEP
jgi:LysR family transcriptional regulator, glycine cleavage system transcriptional activator